MRITPYSLVFDDWAISNPVNNDLEQALWRTRYAKNKLTEHDLLLLQDAAEAYIHLASYPGTTKEVIGQLREIRKAVKSIKRTSND